MRQSRKTRTIICLGLDSYRGWIIEGILRDSFDSLNYIVFWFSVDKPWKSVTKLLKGLFAGEFRFVIAGHNSLKYVPKTILSLIATRTSVFITQFQFEEDLNSKKLINKLNMIQILVVQNQYVRNILIDSGVSKKNVRVHPGGVDKSVYHPPKHSRLGEYILISGDFKARKNPEGIVHTIKSLSQYDFVIHGKNIDLFKEKLLDCKNVKFYNFNMEQNAKLMQNAFAYMCLSKLEGGPIPILEALSCGTPVISTPVGFVPDLADIMGIRRIPLNFAVYDVKKAIEEIKEIYNNDRSTNDLTFGKFSLQEFGIQFLE